MNGQGMLLPPSCLKQQLAVLHLADDPVFVNFVGVHFAVRRGGNVFRSRSGREAVFFTGVNDPIVWTK